MIFPESYKCLTKQSFEKGDYKIFPIRFEDQHVIMKWRNDQIDFLRQSTLLTESSQNNYFSTVVKSLFEEEKPNQLLMSFFEKNQFIGYGGLVHIDWKSLNAEISFLLDTSLNSEKNYLEKFTIYLSLIEMMASNIGLHKIYSYGYRLAEYRFEPLIQSGFINEAILKKHKSINGNLHDVLIYSKIL